MSLSHASALSPVRPPAIVLATGLNGLSTVRSLGAAGIVVWAVVDSVRQPCARSRYCKVAVRRAGETLDATLDRLAAQHGVASGVLLATSDATAHEIANSRVLDRTGFFFAGPHADTVAVLVDKRRELTTIASVTSALPASEVQLPQGTEALLSRLRLPIIFKPRTQTLADRLRIKNRVVQTPEGVCAFYETYSTELDSFIAQEVVSGSDGDVWQCDAVFDKHSDLISTFTFRKLGMAPPHFGVTTLGRSESNPTVVSLTRAIGRAIGYVGPAGFEFKRDSRDGEYKYIEINPRFAMANWFDTCCGVNTAVRTYEVALGSARGTTDIQRNGVAFLDLYGDLYSRLVDDRESVASVISRLAHLLVTPRVSAYWYWRDPMPGLIALQRRVFRVTSALGRRIFST